MLKDKKIEKILVGVYKTKDDPKVRYHPTITDMVDKINEIIAHLNQEEK